MKQILQYLLPFVLTILLAGQAPGEQHYAPSPEHPWAPANLSTYETALSQGDFPRDEPAVTIDPRKVYELSELIDLAQRNHPETRAAWERARQAAAAVGLSQSAYFPYLAASAAGGYERMFVPFPSLKVNQSQLNRQIQQALANPNAAIQRIETQGLTAPDVSVDGGGTLTTDAVAARAAVSLRWLLLDFGERGAIVAAAKERLLMANVGFNAAHQKVVFEVTRRFYEYNIARQKVAASEAARDAANTVEQAAQAKRRQGLSTEPELLQAVQLAAQAAFDLEAARGQALNAQIELVTSLGITPTSTLKVAETPAKRVTPQLESTLDGLIDRALSQRPDLVAKLAQVRAAQAGVRQARAEFYPKVAVDAHAGWAELDVSVADSEYFGGNDPVYGVNLLIELPLFDGFARAKKLTLAKAALREAESELAMARDDVVRDVWQAYTNLQTAVRRQDAAEKLLTAAESAAAAVLSAYRSGLSSYVDVANSQKNLAGARMAVIDTRSVIYTSGAALALSVGALARPEPNTPTTRKKR